MNWLRDVVAMLCDWWYCMFNIELVLHPAYNSLGLTHDGRKAACPANVFIMSPEVVKLAHPYQWSPCSREELHSLVQ